MTRLEDKRRFHSQQHTKCFIYIVYRFYVPCVLNTTIWPFPVGDSEEQLPKTPFLLRLQTNWKVHLHEKTDFSPRIRVLLRPTHQIQIRGMECKAGNESLWLGHWVRVPVSLKQDTTSEIVSLRYETSKMVSKARLLNTLITSLSKNACFFVFNLLCCKVTFLCSSQSWIQQQFFNIPDEYKVIHSRYKKNRSIATFEIWPSE